MGLDFVDFTLRIEKSFRIHVGPGDYDRLPKRKRFEMTAGELHEWVVELCKEKRANVPWSSWNRVRLELARVVGKPPRLIHRGTFIVKELGFSC